METGRAHPAPTLALEAPPAKATPAAPARSRPVREALRGRTLLEELAIAGALGVVSLATVVLLFDVAGHLGLYAMAGGSYTFAATVTSGASGLLAFIGVRLWMRTTIPK